MSEMTELRPNCGTSEAGTHWLGCDCHEAQRDKELDRLASENARQREGLEKLKKGLVFDGKTAPHFRVGSDLYPSEIESTINEALSTLPAPKEKKT